MKGLIQIALQPKIACFLILTLFSFFGFAEESLRVYEFKNNSSSFLKVGSPDSGAGFFFEKSQLQKITPKDSIAFYKDQALIASAKHNSEQAAFYAEKYIKYSQHFNFAQGEAFDNIRSDNVFQTLEKKYSINFNAVNLFYLFSSLIGFFISIILLLKKTTDKKAVYLISGFILIHSFFIFHIFIYRCNLHYRYPDILYASTIFSFLYGPLIYFYLKRVSKQYQFKKIDLLHLIPSVIMLLIVFPIYNLSSNEKLEIILKTSSINTKGFVTFTFIFKLLSLLIYGYLFFKIFRKQIKNNKDFNQEALKWIRSLIYLGMAYIGFYALYGLIISDIIPRYQFLYHLQVVAMASMVLYVGVIAYLKPQLFSKSYINIHVEKYSKSGLTKDFSSELKQQLLFLLNEEKIYKQNDISLEKLANKLGTTRHNASQVINEHFNLNFFELINTYRIKEAQEILKNDIHHNLNIIEVAYEVGFNNKVTFNKSFKKQLEQTPSQYIKSLKIA